MKKINSTMGFLLCAALSACAPARVAVKPENRVMMKDKAVSAVHYEAPSFGAFSSGKVFAGALFGAIGGGIAGSSMKSGSKSGSRLDM